MARTATGEAPPRPSGPPPVRRAVDLLDFRQARGAPATGPEIVQAPGIPISPAHALTRALAAGTGLIEEETGRGREFLGRRLYLLGLACRAQEDLGREGAAAVRAPRDETVLPSPAGGAETDIDRLIARIRAARQVGHAIEISEVNAHAGCVAAPVTDGSGRWVAAPGIAVPEPRPTPARLPDRIAAVAGAARRLSERLGAA